MHVRLEDFNLHDVCEGLLNMFRPLAEKKNIDLRGQFDPAIPTMRQDVTKLQQILENLLSNAIKFTPEGGRVLLKADADARHVILTVTDTGVGIAPEEQELVFQKFRQSGNPLTREHAGTGLGLSIVRELCKLLGRRDHAAKRAGPRQHVHGPAAAAIERGAAAGVRFGRRADRPVEGTAGGRAAIRERGEPAGQRPWVAW